MIPSNDIDINIHKILLFEISWHTKLKSQGWEYHPNPSKSMRDEVMDLPAPICQGTIWSNQPPTILLVALDTIQHVRKAKYHIGLAPLRGAPDLDKKNNFIWTSKIKYPECYITIYLEHVFFKEMSGRFFFVCF